MCQKKTFRQSFPVQKAVFHPFLFSIPSFSSFFPRFAPARRRKTALSFPPARKKSPLLLFVLPEFPLNLSCFLPKKRKLVPYFRCEDRTALWLSGGPGACTGYPQAARSACHVHCGPELSFSPPARHGAGMTQGARARTARPGRSPPQADLSPSKACPASRCPSPVFLLRRSPGPTKFDLALYRSPHFSFISVM